MHLRQKARQGGELSKTNFSEHINFGLKQGSGVLGRGLAGSGDAGQGLGVVVNDGKVRRVALVPVLEWQGGVVYCSGCARMRGCSRLCRLMVCLARLDLVLKQSKSVIMQGKLVCCRI